MILNPSHEITLKGLPSEILDAYVRYKKGSRAIVAWLVQYGSKKYKGVKTLPIKELASLAKAVIKNIKELPEVIHFHFRETIAARKRLSKFFRSSVDVSEDDAETVNHEHFTTSLNEIYKDLCEHCQAQKKCVQQKSHLLLSTNLAEPLKNHYACLPVEDSAELHPPEVLDTSCDECQHEQTYRCLGPPDSLVLEDDEMSIAIETASTLERIHETVTATESIWKNAGAQKTNFVSVAGATNVAWSALRDLEGQLRNDGEDLSIEVLHQRCCLFKDATTGTSNAITQVHALLDSLAESERAIIHYSDCHKLTVMAHCPSCVQKPSDYVQQTQPVDTQHTSSFSVALMDNIIHLMCKPDPGPIILQGSSIYADIGYLLTHRDDKSTSFLCVLGIHLLTTTYKAYLMSLPMPAAISACRITALKFSKQASSVVDQMITDKDSFPCRCPQTLAYHLSNLKDDMDTYSKHRCWDLYFQSPWVAGNHIIEMLDMVSYYGMHLFHYRHYIGALLHSYNVLVQLAGIERIPVLESLCETFHDAFFPSGRPTEHFKNSWARYIGARLKFKKGHKRHGGNDKESWCMAVPAHAARNAAGFGINTERNNNTLEPKLDFARIDPMMRLKQMDWRVDLFTQQNQASRRNSLPSATSRPSSSRSEETTLSSSSEPSTIDQTPNLEVSDPYENHLLSIIQQGLDTSITSSPQTPASAPSNNPMSLPTTSLSHLAIFNTALKLIRQITTKSHDDNSSSTSTSTNAGNGNNKLCICFAHTLLSAADRIVEGRRFGGVAAWKKEEREVVDIVKEVLEGCFCGENEMKVEKEWTWEF